MKKFLKIIAVLPLVALGACSNDMDGFMDGTGTDQNVQISVTPENTNAHCILHNGRGDWTISSVPSHVNVYRGNGALFVKCEGEYGYHGSVKVTSVIESSILANAWQGALAGDDGILYKYPNNIVVPLTRDTSHDIEASTGYAVLKPQPEPVVSQPEVVPPSPTHPIHHILKKKHHVVCKTVD